MPSVGSADVVDAVDVIGVLAVEELPGVEVQLCRPTAIGAVRGECRCPDCQDREHHPYLNTKERKCESFHVGISY